MKKVFRLSVIFSMLSLCFFLPKLNADSKLTFPDTEPEISMDFQDANLKDILKVFSIQSGLNFIASEALQDRKITLYLDKVPLEKAMGKLFKANNLSYELDREANIFIVKDWGKLVVETITKVFPLKYATVSSSSLKEEMSNQITETEDAGTSGGGAGSGGKWKIEEDTGITVAVKKLLSAAGSVIEDFRTNSLVVTDTPSRMSVIAQVIASLDVPAPQVMLEVEMLDVSKNTVDKMGIKFSQTPLSVAITGAAGTLGFPFHSWSKSSSTNDGGIGINNATSLSGASGIYYAQLDFLRTQSDTKYLARPRLLTLNNETAEIRISTNESIGIKTTTTETTTTAEPERTETGVVLRITPQINAETGEITMFVFPKVSEAVQGNTLTSGSSTANYRYRDPEERSTKSVVRVKDGETVVLGGLIRNEFAQVETKLPILGDLPLIGFLFRHKGGDSDKNKQRELLVFITPHIIKDTTDVKLAQTKKVMPPREQNAVSGVNRESVINSSLNTFEKKKR